MLRTKREAFEEREEGFTLIELLVVVIIIGILAAIAIPVFLNQREKAWDAAAKSDLRNAAVQQESYFTDNSSYANKASLTAEGFEESDKVTLTVVSADATTYCMSAKHDSSSVTFYQGSQAGETAPSTTACT